MAIAHWVLISLQYILIKVVTRYIMTNFERLKYEEIAYNRITRTENGTVIGDFVGEENSLECAINKEVEWLQQQFKQNDNEYKCPICFSSNVVCSESFIDCNKFNLTCRECKHTEKNISNKQLTKWKSKQEA